jgi:hypothetical protein
MASERSLSYNWDRPRSISQTSLTRPDPDSLKVREAKNWPTAELSPNQREMRQTSQSGGSVIPRGQKAANAGLEPGTPVRVKEFEEDRFGQ